LKNQGFCVILSQCTRAIGTVKWMPTTVKHRVGAIRELFPAAHNRFFIPEQLWPRAGQRDTFLYRIEQTFGDASRKCTFSQAGIISARYTFNGKTARQLSLYESHPT